MGNKQLKLLISTLCVFAISACELRDSAVSNIMQTVANQRVGQDATAEFVDGLHVVLCGAGSPMPDPKRSGPCVAIVAGETLLIVDSGTGGSRNLGAMNISMGNIDALLLTHFHSDHIDGLGEMAMNRWVQAANTEPLAVIAPTGGKAIVDGFNQAYRQDATYRQAHHTDLVAPLSGKGMQAQEFDVPEVGQMATVFDHNGLIVRAFRVDHEPVSPAVGYRFEYKGRSIVVSGDTAKSANLEAMAQGADVLVHEALSKELVAIINQAAKNNGNKILEKITFDIVDYHTSPVDAAEVAEAAGVSHLLYYHIVPALVLPGMESIFLKGVDDVYQGPTTVGIDGSFISLPAHSETIATGNLL